jgi:hypothetical protein
MFLGERSHIFGIEHLYNGLRCNKESRKTNEDFRVHIYNRRGIKTQPTYTDENIPKNRDHPVWDSLSKTFDSWHEVVALIDKITDLGISFDSDLEKIRDDLTDKINGSKKYEKFFSKFMDRIHLLIHQYNNIHQYEQNISSDSDELDVFNKKYNNLPPRKRNVKEINKTEKTKKEMKVNSKDHIGMAPKVRYHGSKKIGKDFESDEEEPLTHFI